MWQIIVGLEILLIIFLILISFKKKIDIEENRDLKKDIKKRVIKKFLEDKKNGD